MHVLWENLAGENCLAFCRQGNSRREVGGNFPGNLISRKLPKGPFRTKNTTTIAKIVNYYAVVYLLRPPNLLRRGPFLERRNVCNSQENDVCTSCAAIVNHPAVLKILRVVDSLRVVFLVRRVPLGRGPPTTHHPHKDLPRQVVFLGGGGVRIVGT